MSMPAMILRRERHGPEQVRLVRRDLVEHAVLAEAHADAAVHGLDVDVAGRLLDGGGDHARDEADDRRVVGVAGLRAHRGGHVGPAVDRDAVVAGDGRAQRRGRRERRAEVAVEQELQGVEGEGLGRVVDGEQQLPVLERHRQHVVLGHDLLGHEREQLGLQPPALGDVRGEVDEGQLLLAGERAPDLVLAREAEREQRLAERDLARLAERGGLADLRRVDQVLGEQQIPESVGHVAPVGRDDRGGNGRRARTGPGFSPRPAADSRRAGAR
jgi:hypothetical protein